MRQMERGPHKLDFSTYIILSHHLPQYKKQGNTPQISPKIPTMRALIFISALLVAVFVAGAGAALLGGWQPIKNLSDPHVQEIARFAVAEHNKKGSGLLQLSRVVSGETQVVSGVKYRLVLQATGGSGAYGEYEAVVWEKAWVKFRQLLSFRQLKP
ncbi:Cysteine proteinase inhibitor 5 [Apostasia shenzhenica]|uniref:Cysteine proteinase inhibitor 5 n=1 Tax=Apostasia shenzhenica TaxID=1088818 RepID=A0A2I0ARN8_9ASPA|nr:Cysteine proteinase inhibitor 5 [Apostasia shenzhenica]